MAVALRGAAAVPGGNPTTSFTVTIPSAVLAGDDLYLVATSRDHTSGTALATCTDNDTGGNTWTLLQNSSDRKAYLFHKKATSGSASKTVTFAGAVGSSSGVLKAFSGAASGDPTTNIVLEANASGDESHAGFTPTDADSMLCAASFNYANDNAVTSLASATEGAMTMTEKLSTGGADCATAFGHDLQVGGPGATGTFTWAQTNGTTYSITWAIKPAPAAQTISAAGAIGTAESVGTQQLNRHVQAVGAIASAESLGAAAVHLHMQSVGGIVTAEAIGTPAATHTTTISAVGGIATGEAFGSARTIMQIAASGIATAEAFGATALGFVLRLTGVATAEVLGTLRTIIAARPMGVATSETFGTPTVSAGGGGGGVAQKIRRLAIRLGLGV